MLKRPLVRKPMGHPLGLNPAGVLLFRNRALGGVSAADSTVLLRATAKASTPFHPHPSIHLSLLLAGSKVLKRPLVRRPIGHPLGVNPAGVLLFRNRALYIRDVSAAESAESTVLLRAVTSNDPRPKLPPHSTPIHPFHPHPHPPPSIHPSIHPSLFAFSWFEGAETAPGPQTNGPPLGPEGPESCWGSAVSQPCPRRCFCSRIHGAAQGHGQSFHPIPPPSIHPSIHLSLNLAGSKVLKRPLVRKPMGHPLGSAVSQPCPGRCFCGRIRGAAKATAKASTPFHPHPSIHPSLFAFSWFEGAETAPGPQTNWPPLGRESCWGSAVSEPCPRRCFRSRIHGAAQGRYIKRSTAKASTSTPIHPLFAFSWFEGAETAPGPQSYWPPLGLESCWGSAVSEPCPRRCFCSRTITSRLAKCFASICFAACPTVLRNGPCRSLLYPDSCWTSFPIRLLVFALNSSRSFR